VGVGQSPPGGPSDLARIRDTLLLPLVDQINVAQEQMFDQFHRTLMGMVEVFGRLQQEQMGVIREELARIRELTRELQEVQKELGKQAPGASPAAGGEDRTPDGTQEAPEVRRPQPFAGTVRCHPPHSGPSPAPAPDPLGQAEAAPGQGGGQAREPTQAPPPDIHAMLFQRAAALAEERKTRWQKVMDYIMGL
jgi:hypothetical protein